VKNQSASRKQTVGHYVPRYLAVVLLIVGIVTAALNATFGGFTPIMWFLLALVDVLIITCHEVMTIRISLESKK
jgi:hypothetical protein